MTDDYNRMDHIIDPTQNAHIYEAGMTSSDVYQVALINESYFDTFCQRRIHPKISDRRVQKCQDCYEVAMAVINGSA